MLPSLIRVPENGNGTNAVAIQTILNKVQLAANLAEDLNKIFKDDREFSEESHEDKVQIIKCIFILNKITNFKYNQ